MQTTQFKPRFVDIRLNRNATGTNDRWRVNMDSEPEMHVGKLLIHCEGETISKFVDGEEKFCVRFYPNSVTFNPLHFTMSLT